MTTIWEYQGVSKWEKIYNYINSCPFCGVSLDSLHKITDSENVRAFTLKIIDEDVSICKNCGWWRATYGKTIQPIGATLEKTFYTLHGAVGSLRTFDLDQIDSPIREIRDYLSIDFEKRFSIHPKKFEDTVASVFKNIGYHVEVTSFSGDDGIDIILSSGKTVVGVQVKRVKDKIEVEQIRELVGALVYRGLTQGIYVTTSSFSSGSDKYVEVYRKKGYYIELIDADRLLAALKIGQREVYRSISDLPILSSLEDLPVVYGFAEFM